MWASSQTPFGTRQEVAEKLGLQKEDVHIKQIFLGGGFGGKIYNQQAVEAARTAKDGGRNSGSADVEPQGRVHVRYVPAGGSYKGEFGNNQRRNHQIWNFDIYCAGDRGTELFYEVPNHRTTNFNGKEVHPFGTGAWRAPGNNTNTFARESQIDIMAHSIGMDPLEFRLKNMNNQRAINSLKGSCR
jgi:nicotinate dehydrogenase subunit B